MRDARIFIDNRKDTETLEDRVLKTLADHGCKEATDPCILVSNEKEDLQKLYAISEITNML